MTRRVIVSFGPFDEFEFNVHGDASNAEAARQWFDREFVALVHSASAIKAHGPSSSPEIPQRCSTVNSSASTCRTTPSAIDALHLSSAGVPACAAIGANT
jgi:hypothetical protein